MDAKLYFRIGIVLVGTAKPWQSPFIRQATLITKVR